MFTFGDILSFIKGILEFWVLLFLQLLGGMLGALALNLLAVVLILPVICLVIWCVAHIMGFVGNVGGWIASFF
jgi:hypothetical protein